MSSEVWCPRNHRVVSSEPVVCDCGGHELYCCRMRVGSRACGWSVLVPPLGADCGDEDEAR